MTMLQRRGLWIIVVFVLLGAGLFFLKKKSIESLQNTAQKSVASLTATTSTPQILEFLPTDIVTVASTDIQKTLTLSGALRAMNQSAVKAKVAAEVREVLVREGEAVQVGQVLVKMDSTEYDAKLEQARGALKAAQGQLDIAKQTRDNNKALLDKNFISANAFDNGVNQYAIAAANVDSAKGALSVAQKALADTIVKSPIAGLVSVRSVQPGEKVSPDNRLLDIVDLRVLEMEAAVPSQDIASIKLGQQVTLKVEGIATAIVGKVTRINPAVQSGSRSIMTYIQVANTDGQVKAGVFAEAQLALDKKSDVMTIPQTALQYDGNKTFVYAIENNVLQQKNVTLGLQGESNGTASVEVLSGLAKDAQIVKANLGSLRSGVAVKVLQAAVQTNSKG
ncbi:efflux RND transporter periplasmic adaptor subunit [Undibacterium sp. RTI2.1]|uniref:efflux RND transporter periplasmic adaptor subunit n=2 Tax=Undibacterium TaxID=401469 RepID=UPI002B230D9A|nr:MULTISPECIES: efflux RND transporter periplasmic adaptor subunit [unclassified Undibacterium]MEB0029977.1 efflux RND transporter periplasmic adaptor subunit [Undibacterium sp. RTI2.1]MEB0230001.1 efflux RND transporter periplasmic adaptor subunit [Undibacterium sp. 10I3]